MAVLCGNIDDVKNGCHAKQPQRKHDQHRMNRVPEKCCFGPHQYVSPVNKFASRQANGLVWTMLGPRVRNFGVGYTALYPARIGFKGENRVHRVELVRSCENLSDRLSGS